ncbi:MAG: adenine-specific DNA methylase [Gammaproteobacteria bacterium]|nr:adenine-specific DNA methylase [Gammaproteobacteria bacterium]
MTINRAWAMPNSNTFSIKPIGELIERYGFIDEPLTYLDPFCRNSVYKKYCISNDLDHSIDADYHMDALEFLKMFDNESVHGILFDPPYSPRQVSECYKSLDMTVNMQTTQSSFWGDLKKEISRVLTPSGVCITCGWNSGGIGRSNGFEIEEILLVPHGGWHNDTIVTVERKSRDYNNNLF